MGTDENDNVFLPVPRAKTLTFDEPLLFPEKYRMHVPILKPLGDKILK